MAVLIERIEKDLSPLINELGYEIVRVAYFAHGRNKTLQVMIERLSGESANVQDCAKVSRAISVKLDVVDPIPGRYSLEVSSTGMDRPLVKPADFIRFSGKPIVLKTYLAKSGLKMFTGILESASENDITLVLDEPLQDGGPSLTLSYDEIAEAHIDGFRNGK